MLDFFFCVRGGSELKEGRHEKQRGLDFDVLSQMTRAQELSTGPRVMVGFGRAWIVACCFFPREGGESARRGKEEIKLEEGEGREDGP